MNEKPKLTRSSGNQMDFRITPPKLKLKRRSTPLHLVLKSLACVLCPLTVPFIVYILYGCTTVFWWMLGIALLNSIVLLTFDFQKVRNWTELKNNQCGGIPFIIKVVLVILVSGVTTYAYQIELYEVFCVFLFVTGVITGTFFSDISTWWNFRRKNVPYVNLTKDSPKPVGPVFLDLRRKSFNVPCRATNFLPLKRHFSQPTKQLSQTLNCQTLEEVASPELPMSTETPNANYDSVILGYPSLSSSGESDVADAPQHLMSNTPTTRRVISAVNISLSPLIKSAEVSPVSKRRLEFSKNDDFSPLQPLDISRLETPTSTYSNCKVESLMSHNFSNFHM